MNAFAKAADNSKSAPKARKKTGTTFEVAGDSPEGRSVTDLLKFEAEKKAADGRTKLHKGKIKKHADSVFIAKVAELGVLPEGPYTVQNSGTGEKVTFVVQDRSGQYEVKEEQQEALNSLLGEDAAGDLTCTVTDFGFNGDILGIPGVMDAVGRAISICVSELVGSETLTEEQGDALLTMSEKTALKPGTVERLALICGKDTGKIASFLDIIGSNATRYVKV